MSGVSWRDKSSRRKGVALINAESRRRRARKIKIA
jgi:hypothetical protein